MEKSSKLTPAFVTTDAPTLDINLSIVRNVGIHLDKKLTYDGTLALITKMVDLIAIFVMKVSPIISLTSGTKGHTLASATFVVKILTHMGISKNIGGSPTPRKNVFSVHVEVALPSNGT